MKNLLKMFALMAILFAVSMPADAQLGNLVKKVNKGLDKITTKADVATGQATQQENGVIVMNPVRKSMAVEVVEAIGRSTSENFGDVELVLRVNVKEPVNSIALCGSWGQGKTQAFDADGNVYQTEYPSVSKRYDVPEGLPIKIVVKPFLKVHKSAIQFAVVKLVAKCGEASGEMTLKNVPITWDPEEE